MTHVGDRCYAVLNEKNRLCDANSGLINRAGGVAIETLDDQLPERVPVDQGSRR